MTTANFSSQLRELVDQYQQARLNFDDYKLRRRALLNKIDKQYNGVDVEIDESLLLPTQGSEEIAEETSPNIAVDNMKTVVFSALTRAGDPGADS